MINVDIDALMQAFAPPEIGGSTVTEICEATGLGQARVRREIKAMLKDGRARATQKRVFTMDGRALLVPSYALKGGGL